MTALTRRAHPPRPADLLAGAAAWSAAAAITAGFLWLVADVARRGLGAISLSFLVETPADAGRAGGIGPVVVSTLLILAVCMAVAVPLSLATAVLLSEHTRRRTAFGRVVRRSLDALAAVPSIVFGLFGNAVFCLALGMGYSILSGGLTLACMVLPLVIRTSEMALRAVPDDVRLAASALGLSRTTTLLRVLLPAAAPGLLVGLVLGVARAMAETAALLFTSGYVARWPGSLLDSGRAISVHVYDLAMNVPGGEPNAYGAALVLIGALLVINGTASHLAGRWLGRTAPPARVAP